MVDLPDGTHAGVLAFLFVQKLASHLERENILPPGKSREFWTDILVDLQNNSGRHLAQQTATALRNLKLVEE